jgi:hypothetical protein
VSFVFITLGNHLEPLPVAHSIKSFGVINMLRLVPSISKAVATVNSRHTNPTKAGVSIEEELMVKRNERYDKNAVSWLTEKFDGRPDSLPLMCYA